MEIVEFLLKSQEKSDLERILNLTTKETKRTPLHIATLERHHGVAKLLLRARCKEKHATTRSVMRPSTTVCVVMVMMCALEVRRRSFETVYAVNLLLLSL